MAGNGPINLPPPLAARINTGLVVKCGLPILVFLVVLLGVVLWATEALPIAVTGLLGVVLLVITGAVPDEITTLYGFSRPVAYFLIGILGLGLAVHQSGLAERMASIMIFQRAQIRPADVLRFGLIMAGVAIAVSLLLAVPYWSLVGEPLTG